MPGGRPTDHLVGLLPVGSFGNPSVFEEKPNRLVPTVPNETSQQKYNAWREAEEAEKEAANNGLLHPPPSPLSTAPMSRTPSRGSSVSTPGSGDNLPKRKAGGRKQPLKETERLRADLIRYISACEGCRNRRVKCIDHHDFGLFEARYQDDKRRRQHNPYPFHNTFSPNLATAAANTTIPNPAPRPGGCRRIVAEANGPTLSLIHRNTDLEVTGTGGAFRNQEPLYAPSFTPSDLEGLLAPNSNDPYTPLPSHGVFVPAAPTNYEVDIPSNGGSGSPSSIASLPSEAPIGCLVEETGQTETWECRGTSSEQGGRRPSATASTSLGKCLKQWPSLPQLEHHFRSTHGNFIPLDPPFLYECTAWPCTQLNQESGLPCMGCSQTGGFRKVYYGSLVSAATPSMLSPAPPPPMHTHPPPAPMRTHPSPTPMRSRPSPMMHTPPPPPMYTHPLSPMHTHLSPPVRTHPPLHNQPPAQPQPLLRTHPQPPTHTHQTSAMHTHAPPTQPFALADFMALPQSSPSSSLGILMAQSFGDARTRGDNEWMMSGGRIS